MDQRALNDRLDALEAQQRTLTDWVSRHTSRFPTVPTGPSQLTGRLRLAKTGSAIAARTDGPPPRAGEGVVDLWQLDAENLPDMIAVDPPDNEQIVYNMAGEVQGDTFIIIAEDVDMYWWVIVEECPPPDV